jgi:glycosyltransferase involved in cell wall biosynthesis
VKITYITQTRFPTEKAHGHQVAQVCAAMANLGHEVTLVAPTVGKFEGSVHEYYGLPEQFRVERLKNFDALVSPFVPGPLAFLFTMWSYSRKLEAHFKQHRSDLIYLRAPVLLQSAIDTGTPIILELHSLPWSKSHQFVRLFNKCKKIVCLTNPMRDELVRWGVDPERVIVEGDGVNLSNFEGLPSQEEAKNSFSLSGNVIGYVGTFVALNKIEKGVGLIVDAIARLKSEGEKVQGFIVGGPDDLRKKYKNKAQSLGLTKDDIIFKGSVPHTDVARAVTACDILVYPAPKSDHPYFRRDTSPLKLFEYLAADRRIVCADIPPIRDVVSEDSVTFCAPGDAASLAEAIKETLHEDPSAKSARRKEIAQHYGWEKRMWRSLKGCA